MFYLVIYSKNTLYMPITTFKRPMHNVIYFKVDIKMHRIVSPRINSYSLFFDLHDFFANIANDSKKRTTQGVFGNYLIFLNHYI